MATLVTYGDRLLTSTGRESWLKRPSVPLALFPQGSVALLSGDQVALVSYQNIYEQHHAVAAAVNKLNRQIIRLPLRVFRQVTADGEAEPVHQHELVDLLKRPWKRASPATLKQKLTFPALVHGNSLLGKVRDEPNAPPTGLLPLDWRFMKPWMYDDGEVFFWETSQSGRPQFFAPEDIVHVAFEAGNGDLGISPLKQLDTTLRIDANAQGYQASSFEKGVRPSGALVTPPDKDLTPEQRARLREEITNLGQNSFFLLSGGMDWKPFSHTAVEAELINQRLLSRVEVASVYDVDPPLLGYLEHATYSNIGEMHKMLYGVTLGPWLSLIAETLNAQLIDPEPAWAEEGLFVAFDLSEVLRSDTPEEIAAIVQAIGGGVMAPNEGRGKLRMRKYPDPAADKLYMPTNNLSPIGETPEPTEPAPPAPETVPEDAEDVAKRHLDRAKRQIGTKMGAGEVWDRARWIREVMDDDSTVDGFALAARLEQAISDSDGNPAEFKRLSQSI
jgi:HK97 family phage portal protein